MQYAHFIIIFRKIDPLKKYSEFTYWDAKDFQNALDLGATKNEIFKIGNDYYLVDEKEHISPCENIDNVQVKHGRHIMTSFQSI